MRTKYSKTAVLVATDAVRIQAANWIESRYLKERSSVTTSPDGAEWSGSRVSRQALSTEKIAKFSKNFDDEIRWV